MLDTYPVHPIEPPALVTEAILVLLCQRYDIALQTRRLFGQFQVQVNLVKFEHIRNRMRRGVAGESSPS